MTIKDIARLANVSVATVSKVINGKAESISSETKAKIFAIIERENYVPYKKVIDRANRNANMVALIVSDLSDIFSSELARGVEDYFFARDFNVIIASCDNDAPKNTKLINMLKKQNIRGLIQFPQPNTSEESLKMLEQENIFTVIMDDYLQTPNVTKTYFNNRGGVRIAVAYLIEQGHSRIGAIFPKTRKPYMQERFEGFSLALNEHGLAFDPSLIYQSDAMPRKQCGYEGAKHLFAQKVSAIFCCDDHVALGVYRAAQENRMSIPGDLSVIGFDDTIFCELLEPNLTSIRQSAYEIGQRSAELLYHKIINRPVTQSVQVQPQLIVRSSVAAPRKDFHVKKKIAVFGELRMDTFIYMDASDPGHAKSVQTCAGGWALHKAVELLQPDALLYVVGCLGNDAQGHKLVESIMEKGIKTNGIVFGGQLPTGSAFITVSSGGEKNEVACLGANVMLERIEAQEYRWLFESIDMCVIAADAPERLKKAAEELCRQYHVQLIKG